MSEEHGGENWSAPIENRKARADYYFQNILEKQREWYSDKARDKKNQHLFFAMSVIVLGALVSFLQVLDSSACIRYMTALLGASITVIRAVDTLLRPGETWQTYRKASENMKREYRLYLNNSDVYAEAGDEQSAYQLLVERVETAIAEEQQLFWQFHAKTAQAQQPANHEKESSKEGHG